MHIAVERGAGENLRFVQYVDYLLESGLVAPTAKAWVARIKDKGNEANHEVHAVTQTDATEMMDFTGMLLKTVYEFPARLAPR